MISKLLVTAGQCAAVAYIIAYGLSSWSRIWSRQKSAEHVHQHHPGMDCWLCYVCWTAEGHCLLWLCFHCLSAVMARSGPGQLSLLLPPNIFSSHGLGCGAQLSGLLSASSIPRTGSGAERGCQRTVCRWTSRMRADWKYLATPWVRESHGEQGLISWIQYPVVMRRLGRNYN